MNDSAGDAFCSFIDVLLCMLEESLEKEQNKQNRADWTATVKEYQLTGEKNIMNNTTIVTPEQLEENERMAKRICRQRKEISRLYGELGVVKDAYKYIVEQRDNLSSLLSEERKSITRMEQILDASCDARYKLHEKLRLKEKEVTELKEELCKTENAYNKYHEEVTNLRDRIAGNLVTVMDTLTEGDI